MEFGAREIMIALGLLVVIAIALDVIRRIRAHRYESIRMPRRKQPIFDDDKNSGEFGSELPNGGARVVAVRDENDIENVDKSIKQAAQQTKPKLTSLSDAKPKQESLLFDEQPAANASAPAGRPAASKQKTPVKKTAAGNDGDPADSVVVLHVMAGKEKSFAGDKLKDALLKAGLRYGSMKIFHRHEHQNGSGAALFSVANSVKPGTFDLNGMEQFSSPGVSLFFSMSEVSDPGSAFSLMLQTAQRLADELNGQVADDTRNTLTRQMIEHYRQRIVEYLRVQRSRP